MKKSLSIQWRVNLSLAIIFVVIFISSLTVINRSEDGLIRDVAENTTLATADSYFDSINMLMLSGAMANRGVLQQKILSNESLTEARIIRGEPVRKLYGPGTADAAPRDDMDRRALEGEAIIREFNDDQGHRLTVITPMRASADYKGTNCLLCHQAKEGEILGAVRVTYDFAILDSKTNANLRNIALVELGLFIIGIIITSLLLRRSVVRPINLLSATMNEIEKTHDLNRRLEVKAEDEVGRMSLAFNSMLDNFQGSLQQVSNTIQQLSSTSSELTGISDRAQQAAHFQQMRTSSVASAMEQMEAATKSVKTSADSTVSASDMALQECNEGTQITQSAIGAIELLKQDIENSAHVIQKLDNQSQNVGNVLAVIQGIAEQTNLLALNAASEAARAGEQGRGFAVVADEVRTLASRTAESTKEIRDIIQELQVDAKEAVGVMHKSLGSATEGVSSVERAAHALGNIAEEVRVINDMNHQVASAVDEQTAMASSVEQSITEINDTASNTSERAANLNRLSDDLTSLSDQLAQMVQRFRL